MPQSREPYPCHVVSALIRSDWMLCIFIPAFYSPEQKSTTCGQYSFCVMMKGTVKVWEHLSDPGDSTGNPCYISAKALQFFTDLPHLQSYYRRNLWCKGRKETMASPSSPEPCWKKESILCRQS
jgi:hypothetical protein